MIENKSNKGKWMTVQQKYEVICQHQRHPSLSTAKLAEWARREFGLQHPPSRETVRLILKTADSIIEKRKTASTPKGKKLCVRCPQLESELGRFVQGCNAQFVCLSRRLLQTKARRILAKTPTAPALKLSSGWLTRFMRRHGLRFRTLHGEAASVSPATVCEAKMAMQDITRFYELRNIWNMDETGLMYRAAKDRAISKSGQAGLKKDKTRITLALTANADGSEKLEPFFIGRAKRPHCFGSKDAGDLGFFYRNNRKAWMTKTLYTEWIRRFDADMRAAGRDVLLLVDNASSHELEHGELTNVTVQKLPPNTTSHIQPMDAGIIAAFESGYRDEHMQLAVDRADEDSPETTPESKNIYWVDQLQAMRWSKEVWARISAATIANCFRHSGVVFGDPVKAPVRREQVLLRDVLL